MTASPVQHAPAEPRPESMRNPLWRYLLATRPAFLGITALGVVLGLAGAPQVHALSAFVTLALALALHAAVNLLNDYYDHINGSDAINRDRIFPFTGGSRFIQNRVLTPKTVRVYAHILLALTLIGGLGLALLYGWGLIALGAGGILLGWGYSAPPLRLNSRGLGELSVMTAFLALVLGTDYVQRGQFASDPVWLGLPYALMVANLLYINQFPDRTADLAAGKRHWVARLPAAQAAWGYVLILALAAIALMLPVHFGQHPPLTLIALAGLLPALPAARALLHHASAPRRLAPAIRASVLAAHLTPLLLAASLWFSRHGPSSAPAWG